MASAALTYLLQRYIGLAAFIFLFVQIISGLFAERLEKKYGRWIINLHIAEGVAVYFLAFLHPLFFMAFNHFAGHGWDPYAVFINTCVICNSPINFSYTLGMFSFWLLTVAVFAVFLRHFNPWFRANWKKFHRLTYFIFLIVGAHAFLTGTDFNTKPFFYFAIAAYAVVLGIVVFIEIPRLYRNFRNWLIAS